MSYNGLVGCNSMLRTPDCERVRCRGLAQPVNTVTSLAYLPAGVYVLRMAQKSSGLKRSTLTCYAGTLAATGIGSVAYHGRQPGKTHRLHDASLCLTLAFASGLTTYVALNGFRHRGHSQIRRPVVVAVMASAAYGGGRTNSALCYPDSLLQFHGLWHVLSARAAMIIAEAAVNVPSPGGNGIYEKGADRS